MCTRCGRPCPYCDSPPAVFEGLDLGDAGWLRRRERFYARALGPPREPAVYHWEDDLDPHIDVYAHRGTPARSDEVLITGGMSDRAMPGSTAVPAWPRRVELLVRMRRTEDWAAALLREIAAMPFRHELPLRAGAVIEGSREIRPGSLLRHAMLVSATAEEGLDGFLVEGERVEFLAVVFLTEPEFHATFDRGPIEVFGRLRAAGAVLLDPGRASAI